MHIWPGISRYIQIFFSRIKYSRSLLQVASLHLVHTLGLTSRAVFYTQFTKLEKIIEMNIHVRFEIFTAAFKKIHILRDILPWRLVNTCRFGG